MVPADRGWPDPREFDRTRIHRRFDLEGIQGMEKQVIYFPYAIIRTLLPRHQHGHGRLCSLSGCGFIKPDPGAPARLPAFLPLRLVSIYDAGTGMAGWCAAGAAHERL